MQRATAEIASAAESGAEDGFRAAWWARGGLLQTLAGMRAAGPEPVFASEAWPTPDGDELHVHFAASPPGDANAPAATSTRPLILLLHGLEGSRRSPYVRATAAAAHARGHDLAVLEFRSCGGVLNRARRTYHSGETTDLDLVVRTLAARFPARPLLPLGFSLGANVLLKWLGERGDDAPANVLAAAAVSPPFELAACAARCDERYGGAIARHFLRSLIPKAIAKERQHPGCCDPARVRRARTLRAFDDLFTAPLHGFRDVAHYYTTQSCGQFVGGIRRPTLLIAAADDPLIPASAWPRAALTSSAFVRASWPAHGGHVGFVAGGAPWRPRRWAEAHAVQFFAAQLAGAAVSG